MKTVALALCLALAACGKLPDYQNAQSLSGSSYTTLYTKLCIEGVTYISASHSVGVQLDQNSKVIPCK